MIIPWISKEWRIQKAVEKAKQQYLYSFETYAERHKEESNTDVILLLIGLVSYLALIIMFLYTNQILFLFGGLISIMVMLLSPILYQFIEEYRLSKKLTLTAFVIRDKPGDTTPIPLLLRGVEFGDPLETEEEIIDYVNGAGGHLTHAFVKEKTGSAAELIQKAKDKRMRLFPMQSKGDNVPTMVMCDTPQNENGEPLKPDSVLGAKERKVRLSSGWGKIRHAFVFFLECKPIQTSILIKGRVVDIQYALFMAFITQADINTYLAKSSFFIPNRIAESVATYVKTKIDDKYNEPAFELIRKQLNNALNMIRVLQRMLTEKENDELMQELRGGKKTTVKTNLMSLIPYFLLFLIAGIWIGYILLPIWFG